MPKPFDASTKSLARQYPADWARLAGVQVDGPVTVIDSDASIVTADRDLFLLIAGVIRFLTNLEIQASRDPSLPNRLLGYNVVGTAQHGLPVESVAILLRSEADDPSLTGELRRATPNGEYLVFRYRVVRVWEIPVEEILSGSVGTLALAPLARGAKERLPAVLREVKKRFADELPAPQATDMIAVTSVLMGLKYPADVCRAFLRGVRNMKESIVYQMILEEGEKKGIEKGIEQGIEQGIEKGIERGIVQGERKGVDRGIAALQQMVLKLGGERFGRPTKTVERKIRAIHSLERLQELGEHLLQCESWKEFLGDQG